MQRQRPGLPLKSGLESRSVQSSITGRMNGVDPNRSYIVRLPCPYSSGRTHPISMC